MLVLQNAVKKKKVTSLNILTMRLVLDHPHPVEQHQALLEYEVPRRVPHNRAWCDLACLVRSG